MPEATPISAAALGTTVVAQALTDAMAETGKTVSDITVNHDAVVASDVTASTPDGTAVHDVVVAVRPDFNEPN